MDALDKEISDEEARHKKYVAQAEAFRLKAEQAAFKLATLRRAAALRPAPGGEQVIGSDIAVNADSGIASRPPGADQANDVRRGGRKPGAISSEWRQVLASLYLMGGKQSYVEIDKVAKSQGLNLDMSSVRERVRHFVEKGYLEGSAAEGFEVTWDAMEKFGFKRETAPDGAEVISEP